MKTIHTTIDLPESVLFACRTKKRELSWLVKTAFALEMYREGIVSMGKAAELLGITKNEMLGILKDRGVPLNYDVEELEEDRKTWKKLGK
ncbi:MAG: hypothetical protein A7316_06540 [Candidatus Altiarchaeales archaeon WOR_SM1_86-2]|nr:MAG: hypothetical protein A7316_06540 [Candidatus Altiarchaeales archaeon WOR_SM1_86-2]